MTFTHRMATLAAVVLIPVGIAATSYLLSDDPPEPSVPSEVELSEDPSLSDQRQDPGSGSPDDTTGENPGESPHESPGDTGSGTPSEPNEEVVPRPSATEGSIDEDDGSEDGPGQGDDDDAEEGAGGDDG
jgi:hypothetical protein